MAGGAGPLPLRRGTAKGVEAAAAGPQAPLRRCSTTKRKASGKEAAASGRTLRPRASGSKIKEETAAAAGPEAEKAAAAGVKPKRRLPAKDVRWILAHKVCDPPETYEALRRRNPELVPRPEEEGDEDLAVLYLVARAFYDIREKFPRFQDRVRGEIEEKGYIEFDEEWFRRRAEQQAMIDREWPSIKAMMEGLCLSDGSSDKSESDDSDEEEEEDERERL